MTTEYNIDAMVAEMREKARFRAEIERLVKHEITDAREAAVICKYHLPPQSYGGHLETFLKRKFIPPLMSKNIMVYSDCWTSPVNFRPNKYPKEHLKPS